MGRQRIIVQIGPTRLDVVPASRAADPSACRSAPINVPEGAAWPDWLESCAPTLERLVRELDAVGSPATVLYTGPGSISGVFSCSAAAGGGAAFAGAALSLTNTLGRPIGHEPHEMILLGSDRGGFEGSQAQTHVLMYADAAERVRAIEAWVAKGCLEFEGTLPNEAAAQMDAYRLATRRGDDSSLRGVVWIGEHSTVLAVGGPGRLAFARSVGLGVQSFTEALTRPLRNAAGEIVQFDHERALAFLLREGMSQNLGETPRDPESPLVAPQIQPLIQRLATEIKQSLRFGLAESDRARIRLVVAGPGLGVPRLGEAIARAASIGLSTEAGQGGVVVGAEAIRSYAALPDPAPSLLPPGKQARGARNRMVLAMSVGTAVALGLVAYDYFSTRSQTTSALEEAAVLKQDPRIASKALNERLAAMTHAVESIEARAQKLASDRTDWGAVLRLLAKSTPSGIRLTRIDMSATPEGPEVRLRGYFMGDNANAGSEAIRSFLGSLSASPLVSEARLGSAQRGEVRGRVTQSFDVRVSCVPVPLGAVARAHGESAEVIP